MNKILNLINGKKTYAVGWGMLIIGVIDLFNDNPEVNAYSFIAQGAALISGRHAIAKN